jgi:hypothetical protein
MGKNIPVLKMNMLNDTPEPIPNLQNPKAAKGPERQNFMKDDL